MNKENLRLGIIWTAAVIAFLTGVGLCIAGFFVPPIGIISGSVLTALGEFLSFFGAVFGIGEFTRIQIAKIKRETMNEKNESGDSEN